MEPIYNGLEAQLQKVGFPSFEEFAKNPEKYRDSHDELLKSVDNSFQSKENRTVLHRQVYFWKDYKVDNIEKLESIFRDEGVDQNKDIYMEPQIVPCSGDAAGKYDLHLKFYPKAKSGIITV